MSQIIIVHGQKPPRSGEMSPAFQKRLEKALNLLYVEKISFLVITGGQTKKNTLSEAEQGFHYINKRLAFPTILESESKTTYENVINTKKILKNISFDNLIIITSAERLKRIRYLYKKNWPEVYSKATFLGAGNTRLPMIMLLENLYLIIARLDPQEKIFTPITKKLFRNG